MKKLLFIITVLTAFVDAGAQTFKKRYVTALDEKLQGINMEWVSMNNDTLLDLVITGTGSGGFVSINSYQNLNSPSYFNKKNTQSAFTKTAALQIADWNLDNKMDVLVSGTTEVNTTVIFCFNGKGDFTFQTPAQVVIDHGGEFRVADFDNDGIPDLLTFGVANNQPFIRIYKNFRTSVELKFTQDGITASDIQVFDINKDAINDFIVSGRDAQGKSVTSVFFGKPSFKYNRKNVKTPLDGSMTLADLNDDGLFDLTVIGKNDNGTPVGQTWLNSFDTLILDQSFAGLSNPRSFAGDMTSDGKNDLFISGLNPANRKSTYIRELSQSLTVIDTTGLIIQRMGDKDRDGDLDLVQVIDSIGSQWIKYYENTSVALNHRPQSPSGSFAVSTFDKTFIIWDAPADDHTSSPSITYDVWLGKDQSNILSPSFDLTNGRRKVVKHGNAGTKNTMVVQGLRDDRYFYSVQSVDNAYNGSYEFGTGGVSPCFDLVHEDVQACKGTNVTLGAGGNAYWYSMSQGLLGKTDSLKFVAAVNDTLFAFVPQQGECSKNRVYVMHVNNAPPSEKETIYVCKGETVKLGIAPGWTQVSWDTNPPAVNVSSVSFVATTPVTITAKAKGKGCNYEKVFTIKISEPTVEINGDGFQIMKGSTVQLEATGSAETWHWEPASGLDNSASQNPLATPSKTTEYVITGTDSVGCKASARTQILVQQSAFIPNLFTPNGDGKNDNLMIYGLAGLSKFTFKIFNREGSMVYETKDITQATTTGWNGFVSGTRQPSGIYYWKVEGETTDGDKLLLNGKNTGSILLVH